MKLRLFDSVFAPGTKTGKVQVREKKGRKPRYRVHLFLDGEDLPYVRQVTYILHETFSKQRHTVKRLASNPTCKLSIWTWGMFKVKAIVEDKSGNSYTIEHAMEFGDQLADLGPEQFDRVN